MYKSGQINTPHEGSPFKTVPGDSRLTFLPVSREAIFKYVEDSRERYWVPNEIPMGVDADQYKNRLTDGERRLVDFVVAFFAASDGIVNVNLAERFCKEVPLQDAKYFYNFQIMMEDIHAHTYSLLLDAIVPKKADRDRLINAAQTVPVIKKMSEYMFKTVESDAPFAERLLRMACVEGVFFTGCFCAIHWLQSRGLMPALGQSNELIAGDEALHTYFAMYLYSIMEPEFMLSQQRVTEIFTEAVEIAHEFIADALPKGLPEMNAAMMRAYIECQADNLVTLINIPAIYGSKHDFHYMDKINMTLRSNFFERRETSYAKVQTAEEEEFAIATDF